MRLFACPGYGLAEKKNYFTERIIFVIDNKRSFIYTVCGTVSLFCHVGMYYILLIVSDMGCRYYKKIVIFDGREYIYIILTKRGKYALIPDIGDEGKKYPRFRGAENRRLV